MKKIFSVLIAICAMFLFTGIGADCAVNKKINANIKTKRVPAGTVITLKVLDPVGSSTSSLGDQFDLMVTENIKVDNSIVIPQGSVIRGSIEEVSAPKILYKGGIIRLYFDHIVSATGKQVPFYAGICNNKNVTYDGALSSKTTYKTVAQSVGFLKTITSVGLDCLLEKNLIILLSLYIQPHKKIRKRHFILMWICLEIMWQLYVAQTLCW